MNHGRLVFAQVTDLLPRKAFDLAVRRYRGDHHLRRFSCHDQLLGMIFAQLTGRTSLRETVLCLQALGAQRYRCGLRGPLAKSTWADANERRDWRIFQDTALAMIRTLRQGLPVDPELVQLQAQVYALDATFIELCLQLFPWAVFRRHKAAVKAHTQLDLKTGIPVFIRVSHGKKHDLWLFEQLVFEPGAYYVFDKGYCDFGRLYRLHTAGAFFVTRAKKNLDFGVRCRQAVPPDAPVKSDRLMRLRGPKTRQLYPDTLRLIKYVDPETGKRLVFLTNHLTLDALTIALLYQRRW